MTEDELRWEAEAIEAQHTSLARVRATATAWSGSIAGLLGVFSVVAFVKGPTSVSALGGGTTIAVTVLVLLGGLVAAAALVTAALAGQGTPRALDRLDGPALRAANRDAAAHVITLLWWSRGLAALAAVCVLASVGTAWLSPVTKPKTATGVVVVTRAGRIFCGTLGRAGGGLGLSPPGGGPAVPLRGVAQVMSVRKCP